MATAEGGEGSTLANLASKIFVPLAKKLSGTDKKKTGKETESSKGDDQMAAILVALEKIGTSQDDQFMESIDYQTGKRKTKRGESEDKVRGFWDKLFKGRYFEKMGDFTKKSVKYLRDISESGLMSFLIGLAMLAMFDPNGDFLVSMIDMLTGILFMVINLFVSLIPKMINFLMVAVPKIAKALGKAFLMVLGAMFKSLGESNSFLEFVLKLLFFGLIIAKILLPLLSLLGTAFTILASPLFLVVAGIALLAYSFQQAYKNSAKLRAKVAEVWEGIKQKFVNVWNKMKVVWDKIFNAFTKIKEALFGKDDPEKIAGESFWIKMVDFLGGVIGVIADIIGFIVGVVGDLIDMLLPRILDMITFFKDMYAEYIEPVMGDLIEIFKALGAVIGWLWENILKPVLGLIMDIAIWVFKKIFKAIAMVFNWIVSAIKGLIDAGKAVYEFFANFSIKNLMSGIGNIGSFIWESIKNGFSGIKDWFSEIWEWLKNKVGLGKSKEAMEVIKGEVKALEHIGIKGVSDELAEDFFAKLQRRDLKAESINKIKEMAGKDPKAQANLQALMDKFLKESKEISGYQSEKNLVDTKGIIDQLKTMDTAKPNPVASPERLSSPKREAK